jgi:hypothetical protein
MCWRPVSATARGAKERQAHRTERIFCARGLKARKYALLLAVSTRDAGVARMELFRAFTPVFAGYA